MTFFFLLPSSQTTRVLTTINEQSQVLSPSNLLALQRQSTLSISQPRLNYATSPINHRGISPDPDLGSQRISADLEVSHVLQQQQATTATSSKTLIPTVSVGKNKSTYLLMHV